MRPWPPMWCNAVKQAFGDDCELRFVRFFESKKNQVSQLTLARGAEVFEVVAKYYVWGDGDSEYSVLQRAWRGGVAVPEPLARVGRVGFMRVLPGERLRSPVEESTALRLGEWLRKFHALSEGAQVLLRGDCVVPNFVLDPEGGIAGLDFEEARLGEAVEDWAQLASGVLVSNAVMAVGSPLAAQYGSGAGDSEACWEARGWAAVCALMQAWAAGWERNGEFWGLVLADLRAKRSYRPDLASVLQACEALIVKRRA